MESPGADRARGDRQTGALLADVYPRDRDRERAVRWLGWVAYHWGAEPVAWWEIPAQVPGRWLARARFAVAAVIVTAALGAAIGFSLWVAVTLLFLTVVVWGRRACACPASGRCGSRGPDRPGG